jgi:hypothetical protein
MRVSATSGCAAAVVSSARGSPIAVMARPLVSGGPNSHNLSLTDRSALEPPAQIFAVYGSDQSINALCFCEAPRVTMLVWI